MKRRRSRAEAEQLVAEYEAGGMSRTEFCRKHGLSMTTLNRYGKRRQAQGEASGANGWVRVELCAGGGTAGSGRGSGVAVAVADGRRIEIGRGFDAETLLQLLAVLERR